MPVARITVTAVSDEGDNVIVWGRPEHAPDDSEPIGFVFQTKGEQGDVGLAERASRLACGTEAVIDYASVAVDWNLARGLTASKRPAHIGCGPEGLLQDFGESM
jgi:hypothetical protein